MNEPLLKKNENNDSSISYAANLKYKEAREQMLDDIVPNED